MYINIPSQYDIVSMAKRFHIGFYAKCDEMSIGFVMPWLNFHIETTSETYMAL